MAAATKRPRSHGRAAAVARRPNSRFWCGESHRSTHFGPMWPTATTLSSKISEVTTECPHDVDDKPILAGNFNRRTHISCALTLQKCACYIGPDYTETCILKIAYQEFSDVGSQIEMGGRHGRPAVYPKGRHQHDSDTARADRKIPAVGGHKRLFYCKIAVYSC